MDPTSGYKTLTGEMERASGHAQPSLESLCDKGNFHCTDKNKTVLLKSCSTYPQMLHANKFQPGSMISPIPGCVPKCNEFNEHITYNKQPGRQKQVNLLKQE